MPFSQVRRSELTHDEWRGKLQMLGSRYQISGVDRGNFAGWLCARNICGFDSIDLGCNATRLERTRRDARQDNVSHYYLLFQRAGQMQLEQNNRTSILNPGDVALVDSSRPITYLSRPETESWLSLHLDRKLLASYLGFEPQGGQSRSGEALAAGLLRQLVSDAVVADPSAAESKSSPANAYMRLAVFDLIGALFSDRAQTSISPYSDKLYVRACDITRDRFQNPDFGPSELAAEMGISLRYLQALFAKRGGTCGQFIQATRLDYAINLLRRQTLLGHPLTLCDAAHSSGFLDYNYFARLFRRRYGQSPSAYARGARISPARSAHRNVT